MSYKIEVIVDTPLPTCSGKWVDNALRFATEAEATAYGADLSWRWTAVRDMRVVESSDPVDHAYVDGNLRYVDQEGAS